MKKVFEFECEMTDTFGGEPNYSWVRRKKVTAGRDTDRAAVRAAKKAMNLSGRPCLRTDYGDYIELRPWATCFVVFVWRV